jgi:hypothetical protein
MLIALNPLHAPIGESAREVRPEFRIRVSPARKGKPRPGRQILMKAGA